MIFFAATTESLHALTRSHCADGIADRLIIIPVAKPCIQTICCVCYMALEPKYVALPRSIH